MPRNVSDRTDKESMIPNKRRNRPWSAQTMIFALARKYARYQNIRKNHNRLWHSLFTQWMAEQQNHVRNVGNGQQTWAKCKHIGHRDDDSWTCEPKQPSVERFPQLSISHTHYKLQTQLLLQTTCNGHNLNPYLSQLYAQFRRRRATERFSDSEETAMAERRQAYSTYHRQRNSEVNYNNGTRCQ